MRSPLAATPEHWGGDYSESSFEALYQATTGIGYDQNYDRIFDPTIDVPPFFSGSDDPFGGSGGEGWSDDSPGGARLVGWVSARRLCRS